MTSLLIRGGTVIDGSGAPGRRADVGIRDARITAVAEDLSRTSADRVIDAAGMVVCPGFVDIHSHSDEAMFVNSALESALHQGVTCVVMGNCGGASAPVIGLAAEELDRELARFDLERKWSSFAEYVAAVEQNGVAINVCSFVGHGTLRLGVLRGEARPPRPAELEAMRELLATALREGAIGMSTGLIYPPSAYGTTEEIAALASEVREQGGLYASHIRNESARLLEAIEENLEIGRRSAARVELSHHKASGRAYWGKVRDSTALIERAQGEGLDVTADQYPYTASSTGLGTVIPHWVHEGGSAALTERLRDPEIRRRIRDQQIETGSTASQANWEAIVIARARKRPEYAGRSVAELAREAGIDPLEWTCDTLVEHDGSIDIVHHCMSEDDVRLVMQKPWVCIGSDSRANAPYGPLSFGKPHPRSYGTFPRVLGRYSRDAGLFPIEEAVRKMTSFTASRLRLRDRGALRQGAWADVVIFDPGRVIDVATYDDPHRYPHGIAHVIVNGAVALSDGETAPERHGRFLRLHVDAGGA